MTDIAISNLPESEFKLKLEILNQQLRTISSKESPTLEQVFLEYIAQNSEVDDPYIKRRSNKILNNIILNYGEADLFIEVAALQDVHNTNAKKYSKYSNVAGDLFDCAECVEPRLQHIQKVFGVSKYMAKTKMLSDLRANSDIFSKSFNEDLKTEGLRNYILSYGKNNKKLSKYLYEKNYLSTQPNFFKREFMDILETYGTYVFFNTNNIESVKKIKNELEAWRKAGGKKAKMPVIIQVSPVFSGFQEGKGTAFANNYGEIRFLTANFSSKILRHEIMHLNDRNFFDDKPQLDTLFEKVSKTENGAYRFANEFTNAGLDDFDIKYAHTDHREFIASAVEGDMSKYSEEFKKVLIKLGMPSWVFALDKK